MPHTVAPYWRLSGFYLFYFASLGALVPYWSLYLKSLVRRMSRSVRP